MTVRPGRIIYCSVEIWSKQTKELLMTSFIYHRTINVTEQLMT